MDDAGPRSLFVVLDYAYMDPPYFSILQLEPMKKKKKTIVDKTEYDIHFNPRPKGRLLIRWLFSPPTSSSDTEDLYLVPNWGFEIGKYQTAKPLQGYKFNLSAGMCEPIPPPLSSKPIGCVVNLGGRIYLLARGWTYDTQSVFQCYDPVKKLWNPLEPFPHHRALLGNIVGTAVWGDTILFNVASRNIWAYDVIRNKWYPVEVEDNRCYDILGEAVVLGDTIYTLTNRGFDIVVAISIAKKGTDCDLVVKCSQCSDNLVPGIEPIFCKGDVAWSRTRRLVHLGKDSFCLVQCCEFYHFRGYQPIQLTYIKQLESGKWMIVKECIHKEKIAEISGVSRDRFELKLCFSLPKGATTALKEGKIFNLEPYPEEDYASNPVQEEEIVTLHKEVLHATSELDNDSSQTNIIDEQGHSIYVRDLPRNASVRQLEKGLKKFGPIKRDGIKVVKNKKGKCSAFVEFESATSQQRAIEASTIIIGCCPAKITGKRLTGLTPGHKR